MCAGSSNLKSRSVSLTFASTGRDSCFPAYSLSLSIISVFPVSPFARIKDVTFVIKAFQRIISCRLPIVALADFVFADHVLFAPIKTFSWRIISSRYQNAFLAD
jgi:hypothetical protein